MKEVREVNISLDNRAFALDLALEDSELIETVLDALTEYVSKGFRIKIRESYVTSLSDSARVISKIISSDQQMYEWRDETRQLISIIRKAR